MSSRPWMPLYVADFLLDTLDLELDEIGTYIILICLAWRRGDGSITGDMTELKKILQRCTSNFHGLTFNRIVPKLLNRYFEKRQNGDFYQKRVENELRKARELSEKQSRNAKERWAKPNENNKVPHANAMPSHSQSHSHKKERGEIEKEFLEFWIAYPKKKAKQDAIKAYRAVRQNVSHQTLMAGLLAAIKSDHRFSSSVYTPFPASWLRSGCYEDESGPTPATDKNRFRAYSDSLQFKAWKSHFQDNKNLVLVRELNQRELEGRPFSFESEWPPNHGGSNGSSMGVDAGRSGTSKVSAVNGQVGTHEPQTDRKDDGSFGGCRQTGAEPQREKDTGAVLLARLSEA